MEFIITFIGGSITALTGYVILESMSKNGLGMFLHLVTILLISGIGALLTLIVVYAHSAPNKLINLIQNLF